MNFVEGLPSFEGYTVVMVVVDKLSNYTHFIRLHHPYTVLKVAKVFMKNVFKLHGLPQTIVNDRDLIFTSQFWKEFSKFVGQTSC